ncbi:hypothetical protein [Microbacterium phyllosphaerae]|uniref:hypothetical protein n=1 Tax=Microbacterium phyllosphaerae TaxID=124798 RepID=UPI0011AE79CF|nr:hypothetical protein [Microbacterium phyllosphaerae]
MTDRVAASTAVFVIAGVALVGCGAAPGVTLRDGSETLPACPITKLAPSTISVVGVPGCDLEGSGVDISELASQFDIEVLGPPGGEPSLTIPAAGAVFSQGDGEGRELLMVNWGADGIGLALIDNGQLVNVWASSETALELQGEHLKLEGVG